MSIAEIIAKHQKAATEKVNTIALLTKNVSSTFAAYDRASRQISANESECATLWAAWQVAQDALATADGSKAAKQAWASSMALIDAKNISTHKGA